MITIHKFPLPLGDDGTIRAPANLTPLHVGPDATGKVCLWASLEDQDPKADVPVSSVGTGWPVPPGRYVGSAPAGGRVWHYYLGLP